MNALRTSLALLVLASLGIRGAAQAPKQAPGDPTPILRLEAGGPTSYVTGLAFGPDGRRLYTAGWDKVVRAWDLNEQGRFVLDPDLAFRVPLGPGAQGALNALAVSPDGAWLAVAGQGTFRGAAGFGVRGFVLPTLGTFSREMREDLGTVWVFNVRTQAARPLRGHTGTVLSLAFAPGDKPVLVSAGVDWDGTKRRNVGAVRAWDLSKDADPAVLTDLPEPTHDRPGLALWRTGEAKAPLHLALAWGDGKMRFWDLAAARAQEEPVWKYTVSVAAEPKSGRLFTAEYGTQQARLRQWRLAPGPWPKPEALDAVDPDQVAAFPEVLALVAGPQPLAATVVRRPPRQAGETNAYTLQLFTLSAKGAGTLALERPLWKGSAKQPALAVSPTGRYLAVAGNDRHDVLIFDVPDLLKEKEKARPQTLRSVGTTFLSAALAVKGDDLGLLLSTSAKKNRGAIPAGPAAGDLVFDFNTGRLIDELAGWKASLPDTAAWRVELKDGAETPRGPELHVFENNKEQPAIVLHNPLGPRPVVTDFALLPQHGPTPPLLAVATHLSGEPRLSLYNAHTGEELRQLTGHVDRIYSLALSADGRLLVSAGEDQTVCVWSLTNLPKHVGKVGLLPGVAVAVQKGALVVARVEADSPLRAQLQEGDVIEGLVVDGKLRPFAASRDFYEAMLRTKPGQEVTLRLRTGQGPRDRTVRVGQAVDERKPLLTLFVTRGERPADRHWIGWTPHGPYEADAPKAEQYVGWHFNTGERQAPTRFALAGEYRKQYYRPGLLKDLVARADAALLPPAPPLPAPKLAAIVEDNGNPVLADAAGHYLLRHPRATVKLDVQGRPLDTLNAVTWQLADGPVMPFQLDRAGQLVPEKVPLQRGVQQLRLRAEVPEIGGAGDWQGLMLRYQPPAPRIETSLKDRRFEVRDAAFTLKARVHPGLAGEPVTVRIVHKNKKESLFTESKDYTIDPAKPLELNKALQLQPGWNLIEVSAVNRNALAGFASAETADPLRLEINFFQKVPPPRITVQGIVPEGAPRDQPPTAIARQPVRVSVPKIQVVGQIEATAAVTQAEWEIDGAAKPEVQGHIPAGEKKLNFRETVPLKPGLQTVRLRAKTETSEFAEGTLSFLYVPPAPGAAIVLPRPDFVVHGDGDAAEVELHARLALAPDTLEFQAIILRDGQEVKTVPVIDRKTATLTAKVALAPGAQRLQVQLRNQWGSVFTSPDVRGRFLRPPRILSLDVPALSERSLVAATARVRSLTPLRAESVMIQVSTGLRRAVPATITRDTQHPEEWVVAIPEVPLDTEPGVQQVQLWVSNTEAEALQPKAVSVTYRPKLPPPVVEIIEPDDQQVMCEPAVKVRCRIQSSTPLQSVRLVGPDGKVLRVPTEKLAALGKDGVLELDTVLLPGKTVLRLEATNQGGETDADRVVSYVPPPVQLRLERLVAGTGPALVPADRGDGGLSFPDVAGGRVQLEGRVLWDAVDDQRLAKAHCVRVYVNGFQQLPAVLEPAAAGSRVRAFRAPLILGREHNHIEVFLPGLAQDQGNRVRSRAEVVCKRPELAQRLHLLIVSYQANEGLRITDQFKRALGTTAGAQGELRSAAFDPIIPYGPLTGDFIDPVYVYQQLAIIKDRIVGLAQVGATGHDVVVFYFQGAEAIDAQGNLYGGQDLAARRKGERGGLACDLLVNFFADMPGAQILLLDVGRPKAAPADGRDKVARWTDFYPEQSRQVAVVRYAWLGQPDVPPDDRLIKALEKALPKAVRLSEVTKQVHDIAEASKHFKQSLWYADYVSKGLENLLVNRKP